MQLLSKLRENCTLFSWERYQEPRTVLVVPHGVEAASKTHLYPSSHRAVACKYVTEGFEFHCNRLRTKWVLLRGRT